MSLFPAYTEGAVPASVVPLPEKGMTGAFNCFEYITSQRSVYVFAASIFRLKFVLFLSCQFFFH